MFGIDRKEFDMDEMLALTDEYTERHEFKKFEGRLFYKNKVKYVPQKELFSQAKRMHIAADLGCFEVDSGLPFKDAYVCYVGLEMSGYKSFYGSDYENVCEVARLFAEEYNTSIFLVPHFKEKKPGSLTQMQEHIHILCYEKSETFEHFLDRFSEKFEDNEK